MVEAFGTGKIADEQLTTLVQKQFDLTPYGIIKRLDLRKPIYKNTASYGHFGRNEQGFTWELTDYTDLLRSEAGL
jgi:S-adenosylmethionine synthetase